MIIATRILATVAALVLMTAQGGLSSTCSPSRQLFGEGLNYNFGHSVGAAGDVNNDGTPDFIVGAPFAADSGKAYVYSGLDNGLLHEFTGEAAGDCFGWSVAGAGDVDQDGHDDLIIGAYLHDGERGRVYVYSGKKGDTLYTFSGGVAGDKFGYCVDGAGDVDGDTYVDVIIGAIGDDNGGVNRGAAYVYSGIDGSELYAFIGDASVEFGFSVAGVGDVDKDDFDDLAVGQPAYVGGTGKVYVFSGQEGTLITAYLGEFPEDGFGWSVSGIGDANNDGYADVVAGAPFHDGCVPAGDVGRAYLLSPNDSLILAFISCTIGEASDLFGVSVSGVDDVDGDGSVDMLVGAYKADPTGDNSGRVSIFSGVDGTELLRFDGPRAESEYGISVVGLGDVNGDGHGDVLVGAHLDDSMTTNAGAAYIYFLGDIDNDGLIYACDNCPFDSNVVQEDADGDGVGDSCDNCLTAYNPDQADADSNGVGDACDYACGDADGNDILNISDAVYLINYIFAGGPAPYPLLAGDNDCNLIVNVSDAVYLLSYIFGGGPEPCAGCS